MPLCTCFFLFSNCLQGINQVADVTLQYIDHAGNWSLHSTHNHGKQYFPARQVGQISHTFWTDNFPFNNPALYFQCLVLLSKLANNLGWSYRIIIAKGKSGGSG